MNWFERLMDTAWKHSSASDSLYETGTEGCMAIIAGAAVAGLVTIVVLAARVRKCTPTPSDTAQPVASAIST